MRLKYLLAVLALLALSPIAGAGELSIGVGSTVRYGEGGGRSAAVATVAWRTEHWEMRALIFGQQIIYPQYGGYPIAPQIGIVFTRLWSFRTEHSFQPEIAFGVMLKGAERCGGSERKDCNRLTPLPFAFCPHFGAAWKNSYLRLALWHCSNDGFDYGRHPDNLGRDFVLPEIVVWRSSP